MRFTVSHSDDSIASAAGNPFRFAGYRYDTESYLYDLRNRTYNPMTGRFLQFDPSAMRIR